MRRALAMRTCCACAVVIFGAFLGTLVVTAANAQTVCTAADVSAQDTGCPIGTGPCTITKTVQVGDGCVLDFGARDVTISGRLDTNWGTVSIAAASLTIAPGGLIDGRGNQTSAPGNQGGMISIRVAGSATIEKTSRSVGRIDVSGTDCAGTIAIDAGGSVTVGGKLNADQLSRAAGGGTIRITAATDIVSLPSSVISATGGDQATASGGEIDLTAGRKVTLGDGIDLSGSCGGILNVHAGDAVTMQRVTDTGTGDGGGGGCVDVTAGTSTQVLDKIDTSGGASSANAGAGNGGVVCINAQFGNLTVAGDILAEGAAPDGGGGETDLTAQGSIIVPPLVMLSARSNGGQGCGGTLSLAPNLALSSAALLDVSGGGGGGEVDICAGTDVTLSGGLDASGRAPGATGGIANVEAGANGPGTLLVQNAIDVSGGACSAANGCGSGGCATLTACDLSVASTGSVLAGAPQGGAADLIARAHLSVFGKVTAAKTTAAGTDGSNTLEFPTQQSPTVSGPVAPAAIMTAWKTCTATDQHDCLMPCPVCGDGIVEFPETCDNNVGTPLACDGCSAVCQIQNCDDGQVCTVDSCDPSLGCRHLPAPAPCTEPLTATPTKTPTPMMTASRTATPTTTSTATPSAVPASSATPISTPTPTLEPPPTETPTPEPTATTTLPATPVLPGDANCDDQVTAADLSDLIALLASGHRSACGADADRDGIVDSQEIGATIETIFAP